MSRLATAFQEGETIVNCSERDCLKSERENQELEVTSRIIACFAERMAAIPQHSELQKPLSLGPCRGTYSAEDGHQG